MCDNKKEKYLEKINYYTSINDVYKINKYNYKYEQLGGDINLLSAINNFIKNKTCIMNLILIENKDTKKEKKTLIKTLANTELTNDTIKPIIEELIKKKIIISNITNENSNISLDIECNSGVNISHNYYKLKNGQYIF